MNSRVRYLTTIVAVFAATGLALALIFAPQPAQVEQPVKAAATAPRVTKAAQREQTARPNQNQIHELTSSAQSVAQAPPVVQPAPTTPPPTAGSAPVSEPSVASPKPKSKIADRTTSKGQRDARAGKGTGNRERSARLPKGLKLPSHEVLNDMAQSIDDVERMSRARAPSLSEPLH